MPKSVHVVNVKKVIDALKTQRMSYSELKNKTNIPEKSLARILKEYLEFWGLAKKVTDEDGREKWSWIEDVKEYRTVRELDADLNHSKKILPAIDMILAEDWTLGLRYASDMPQTRDPHMDQAALEFKESMLQHLESGYPDIYHLVLKLRATLGELTKLYEKTETRYEAEIAALLAQTHFHNDKFPEGYPLVLRQRNFDSWKSDFDLFSLSRVASHKSIVLPLGFRWSNEQFKFIPDNILKEAIAMQSKRRQVFEVLSIQLTRLGIRTDMGRPLDGHCKLCPKIRTLK
jgi:hypothetical protein